MAGKRRATGKEGEATRRGDGQLERNLPGDPPAHEPAAESARQVEPNEHDIFDSLIDDNSGDDAPDSADSELVTTSAYPLGFPETETVNALVAMAGLSTHTQRAYQRWIKRYLADVNRIDKRKIDLKALNIALATSSLGTAMLKAWLGHLKSKKLGKQSIMQAKAAIVWLAQHKAELGRGEYSTASGLSRVKAPRAESGQREGTLLTQDEVRQLIRPLRKLDAHNSSSRAPHTALLCPMLTRHP